MKNLIYSFIIMFSFIQYSYAVKVGDYIKIAQDSSANKNLINFNSNSINKILEDTMSSVESDIMKQLNLEIIKVQENLEGNINKVLNKFDIKIQKSIDKVNNNIIEKAEKLVDDATNEYNSLIETKNKTISTVESLIDNLPTYVLVIKIIIFTIIFGLFLLMFLFWKSYKNAKRMIENINNINNNEFNRKLEEIDLKMDKILSKLK